MTLGGWSAPSEEDLEKGGDYTILPEDEYLAKVTGIEVKTGQPNKFPSKNDPEPTHDMLVVKLDVLSFASGEPLEDVEEEPVVGPLAIQAWLNPKKRGLLPQPAKTRKFFAAVLGQNLGDPINIESLDELIGKTLIVSLKPNGGYNNAQDFRPIKRSRSRGTTQKGPVDGEELMERAKEIFNEDAADNVSPVKGSNKAPDTAKADDLDF